MRNTHSTLLHLLFFRHRATMQVSIICTLLFSFFCFCQNQSPQQQSPIFDRLQPVPGNAGFRMHGYFVWGGSMIKAEGRYHLFASRWPTWQSLGIEPEQRGDVSMLGGYRDHSEIVHAVSDDPLGPFEFVDVAVAGRGGTYWDGQMCHNPKIVKINDLYVLYYIGRSTTAPERKIGYAWSKSVNGPWQRLQKNIPLTEDANNPAPYIAADGSVTLAFRDRDLTMFMARAHKFSGRYQIVAANIVPGVKLEDPTLYFNNGQFHMALEDNVGGLTGHERFGAHLISSDGLLWRSIDPITVYSHTIRWTDGGETTFDRRERPELLNLNNPPEQKYDGQPTHLITGVLLGEESWCVVQEISRKTKVVR